MPRVRVEGVLHQLGDGLAGVRLGARQPADEVERVRWPKDKRTRRCPRHGEQCTAGAERRAAQSVGDGRLMKGGTALRKVCLSFFRMTETRDAGQLLRAIS